MLLYSFDNFLLSLKALIFHASLLIYKHNFFSFLFVIRKATPPLSLKKLKETICYSFIKI